jgi:hypothetical protein
MVDQQLQPHHYWWAGVASMALTFLRSKVKLDATQSEAWQIVSDLLQSL